MTLLISFLVYLTGLAGYRGRCLASLERLQPAFGVSVEYHVTHVGGAVVHAAVLPVPAVSGEHPADPGAVRITSSHRFADL